MLEIVGDSHVVALSDAARRPEAKGSFTSRHGTIRMAQLGHGYHFLAPFFSSDGESVSFTQDAARSVFRQLNPDAPDVIQRDDRRRFVFMFGLYPSLGYTADHWTKHTAAIWSQDRQFVSKSAFDAIIDETLKQSMAFFRQLKAMNVGFSVASCCPIPAGYQKHAGKKTFAQHEVALIFSRFRDRAVSRLEALGIRCHLPPPEVYDAHGSMLDAFAKKPGDFHANPNYGRLMLAKILREVDSLP